MRNLFTILPTNNGDNSICKVYGVIFYAARRCGMQLLASRTSTTAQADEMTPVVGVPPALSLSARAPTMCTVFSPEILTSPLIGFAFHVVGNTVLFTTWLSESRAPRSDDVLWSLAGRGEKVREEHSFNPCIQLDIFILCLPSSSFVKRFSVSSIRRRSVFSSLFLAAAVLEIK